MKWLYWIKDNLTAVLISVVAILGAGIFWRYHKRRVEDLKDNLIVQVAHDRVKVLNKLKKTYEHSAQDQTDKIKIIDKQILSSKRVVVEMHQYAEKLTDREVLDEFERLGY
jgi:hypothetical protein